MNPTPGQPPTPNAVNVDLDGAGDFSVFNNTGTVNVLIDVVGYYDDHTHADDPTAPDVVAFINSDGTIRSGGEGIESITYDAGDGRYEIEFDDFSFTINADSALATTGGSTPRFIATASVGGSTLVVYIDDINGNSVQNSFTIAVWDSID